MFSTQSLNLSPRFLTCALAGVLLSLPTIAAHASSCVELSGCERQICEKESELAKAKEYGDIGKTLGLQNSLVHLKSSCAANSSGNTDKYNGKLSELNDEYQTDLDDALEEYEDDLAEAKAEGKADKIERAQQKYQQKIQKVSDEYERKLAELEAIR